MAIRKTKSQSSDLAPVQFRRTQGRWSIWSGTLSPAWDGKMVTLKGLPARGLSRWGAEVSGGMSIRELW